MEGESLDVAAEAMMIIVVTITLPCITIMTTIVVSNLITSFILVILVTRSETQDPTWRQPVPEATQSGQVAPFGFGHA